MSQPQRPDWIAIVRRDARDAGIELPPDVADELAGHLEDVFREACARGESEEDARRAALRELEDSGGATLGQLAGRPRRHAPRPDPPEEPAAWRPWRGAGQALRLAFRQFARQRPFAVLTVLVLGLGTGAAATVYSIVDTVVLRPLPYRAPDRLVTFWDTNAEKGVLHDPISPVTFMDYHGLPVFDDAAAWWRPDVNLEDPGLDPVRVRTIETSPNLFRVLGVSPAVGAGFPDDRQMFSREQAIVISDRLWRTRYEANPAVIGRTLTLNGEPWTVLGVMPPGFGYPGEIDVWQRLRWDMTQHDRHAHFMEAVARLSDGVDLAQARADAGALAARLGAEFPSSNRAWSFQVQPLLEDQLGYYRPALLVMFGAVGLLLVIACLNVAALLVTRSVSRTREIAVRVVLGARRSHLVGQLLMESLVLSVAGVVVGLLAARVLLPLIAGTIQVPIPRLAELAISGRVVGFSLVVLIGTTVLFGVMPALVLLRRHDASMLRSGERGNSRRVRTLSQVIVAGEVALACALLIGSALLVRSVARMTAIPTGVAADDVVVASVQLGGRAYESWPSVADTHAAILEALRQQPGIRAAGSTNFLPFETGWRNPFFMNGARPASVKEALQATHYSVSEGYFEAMGARLVSGRFFTDRDTARTAGVVVVNDAFARRYADGRDILGQMLTTYSVQIGPLGRNLLTTRDGDHVILPAFQVIGVVADVRNAPLGQSVEPAIYFPVRQFPFRSLSVAMAATDRAAATEAMRRALRQAAPGTPVGDIETWLQKASRRTAEPRLLMTTLTVFAALAALLAALGVYAMLSWSVAQRRRELAIRLTLGASPPRVGALVIAQSLTVVVAGVVLGAGLVGAMQGVLASVLFDVTPHDSLAMGGAIGLIGLVSLVASAPALRRAMRVDPVEGLRDE